MDRAMWRCALAPGAEGAYDEAHASPPLELLEHLRSVGMRNYSVFRDGLNVIGYFEHADLELFDRLSQRPDPAKDAWDRLMAPLWAEPADHGHGMRIVRRQVFRLPT